MKYKIKTYIPTLSSFNSFSEIKNEQLLSLNKFILSNDENGVISYFNYLLDNENYLPQDKLFCLIFLRSLSMGNVVTLKLNNKQIIVDKVDIKLNIVLDSMLKGDSYMINDFVLDEVNIKFKIGSKLYYKNFNEVLVDIVDDIFIEGFIEDYKDNSSEEKEQILLRLKKEIKIEIKKHILSNSPYYSISTLPELETYKINLYNNTAYQFVKALFTTNLSNFYTKLYHCSQKLNLTYDNFLKLTPSETDLLLAIYKSHSTIK